MPAMRPPAAVALLILAATSPARGAEIKLGAPFGEHMVLQRDRPIVVWGVAAGDSTVEVRLGPRQASARAAADGRWSATLEALPAGGPLVLSAESEGARAEAADVLVGDVWLCSGQSNMQMTLKECEGGPEAADAAGTVANLRACTIGRRASAAPESGGEIRWLVASRDASKDFSGVGYFFATTLLADPALRGVPVGVIDASFGATMCEAWIPAEALGGFAPEELRNSMFGIGPSGLYNGMIAPLGKSRFKGVVWYQGEGNSDWPGLYPRLLAALFASWRDRFETPDLPFIVIQLPDFSAGWGGISWAWIREAQAVAVRAAGRASLAIGIETNDGTDLHPKQKREIGRRAALLALRDVYGRPIVARGPVFREARSLGDAFRVTFETEGDGLASRGGPIRGFALAGADGRYRYADAVIEGDAVVLRSEAVPAPLTVRYAWAGVPDSNLVNRSGLPAAPFRTDSARPDADVQRQPIGRLYRTRTYEATIGGNGSVTSLVVGGKQFLSNEPGWGAGTTFTGGLGPRNLLDVREPGPGIVEFQDADVGLVVEFGEKTLDWTVENRGKGEIRFRVALHPKVAARREGKSGPVTLRRGAATVVVTGADILDEADTGPVLETILGGRSKRRLSLTTSDR